MRITNRQLDAAQPSCNQLAQEFKPKRAVLIEEAASRELFEEAGLTARSFKFITLLSGKDMYYRYPNGDEIYNVMAIYEAIGVQGNPKVNDNEGLELRYFSLDKRIENLNPFTEHVLRRAGYITEW
jgi:NTP pyrophosphohydrolases containing a Zn-finger, probably nucleic-acid-binding